jgi:hypothetical protein
MPRNILTVKSLYWLPTLSSQLTITYRPIMELRQVHISLLNQPNIENNEYTWDQDLSQDVKVRTNIFSTKSYTYQSVFSVQYVYPSKKSYWPIMITVEH